MAKQLTSKDGKTVWQSVLIDYVEDEALRLQLEDLIFVRSGRMRLFYRRGDGRMVLDEKTEFVMRKYPFLVETWKERMKRLKHGHLQTL